ncbi:hypothetical protein MKZ08_07870 [Viridibacillus sp. FSL R5-0477]|uniref:Uncharacterized protein n=1 Tax=Viridibacillus arenosi FSL R5-213 TaxID=1227360 RepID=W4EWP7_9BACL|nr:hypothetical protein [Viridibacillus arenosi]ETT84477.1 hypothetical protein C176_11794 [Viridibacillus arenosi FSL R5-213]
MKNIIRYGFFMFTIVLTVIGFSKLINSVDNGTDSANKYLRISMGGSMDADDFRIITEGYILSNIILGGIMFLVGLVFFCFCVYKLLKKFN